MTAFTDDDARERLTPELVLVCPELALAGLIPFSRDIEDVGRGDLTKMRSRLAPLVVFVLATIAAAGVPTPSPPRTGPPS